MKCKMIEEKINKKFNVQETLGKKCSAKIKNAAL